MLLLLSQERGNKFLNLLRAAAGQAVDAQVASIGLVGEYGRPVVFGEIAEDQPPGFEVYD